MEKCINCGKDIPAPQFIFGGRANGKTLTILYHNIRQMCCSDECCREWIEKTEEDLCIK